MRNIWSAIFNKAVVDSNSNSLSLFDAVEEVTINFSNPEDVSKPKKNIPINFSIVSLWHDKDVAGVREFDYLVEMIDPNGQKLNEFKNRPKFEAGKKRLRTIVQINGMLATVEGEYKIVIKYKDRSDNYEIASEIPLDVRFILKTDVSK